MQGDPLRIVSPVAGQVELNLAVIWRIGLGLKVVGFQNQENKQFITDFWADCLRQIVVELG